MKKTISLMLLITAVTLTSCTNGSPTKITQITFPAYTEQGNSPSPAVTESSDKFSLSIELPKNWALKNTEVDENMPSGDFSTPLFIYDGDKPIGYIGFNRFTPYPHENEIPEGAYYKTVYPALRLSSMYQWIPGEVINSSENSETHIADIWYMNPKEVDKHTGAMPDVPVSETMGILSYNKKLQVFIGIAFMPGTLDEDEIISIGKTVSIMEVK